MSDGLDAGIAAHGVNSGTGNARLGRRKGRKSRQRNNAGGDALPGQHVYSPRGPFPMFCDQDDGTLTRRT